MQEQIDRLNKEVEGFSSQEVLAYLSGAIDGKICFATSLGAEDQVLSFMLYEEKLTDIDVFTLDTGRMFQETYDILERTIARYKTKIDILSPDKDELEALVNDKGINLFYESIENRKECCKVRKINPLKRKLQNYDAWIVGLRKEQSVTRTELKTFEWDEANQIIKINPLANWTEKEVWNCIKKNTIPYNKLHDNGFPSIGCAPCTKAVGKGEDVRSGRWWWENPEFKECGLHK